MKGGVAGSEIELRYQQLEKRVKVMETSLADERKLNKELEADLQTAGTNQCCVYSSAYSSLLTATKTQLTAHLVDEGIKYRDHLARMLDIREKDARAQGNIKSQNEKEEAAHNATLKASLREAEKVVEFERADALRLQTEVKVSLANSSLLN